MDKAKGHIRINILKDSDHLLEKFKDAFRFTMENYVDPTPIKYYGAEFRQDSPSRIDIIYSYEPELEFQYNLGEHQSKSSIRNARAYCTVLFEIWTKFTIENLFENELEVETKNVAIKFFENRSCGEKML